MTRDEDGRTPLHGAASDDDAAEVASLIDAGADPDAADTQGFRPLHFAAQQGSLAAARVLLQRGAEVDSTDVFGHTPLFAAVYHSRGRGDLVRLLRDSGADPHHANLAGQTPADVDLRLAVHPDRDDAPEGEPAR